MTWKDIKLHWSWMAKYNWMLWNLTESLSGMNEGGMQGWSWIECIPLCMISKTCFAQEVSSMTPTCLTPRDIWTLVKYCQLLIIRTLLSCLKFLDYWLIQISQFLLNLTLLGPLWSFKSFPNDFVIIGRIYTFAQLIVDCLPDDDTSESITNSTVNMRDHWLWL